MGKFVSKQMQDGLDSFVANGQPAPSKNIDLTSNEYSNTKKIKKQDGLIERVDIGNKIFITEDNRQLLRD